MTFHFPVQSVFVVTCCVVLDGRNYETKDWTGLSILKNDVLLLKENREWLNKFQNLSVLNWVYIYK